MNTAIPLSVGVIQGLILVWPVLALALAYRLFDFPDISVEGSFLLGGAAFAVAAQAHWHPLAACAAAMLAGGLLGMTTGFIHSSLRLNKFLAGILVTAVAYSLALRVMGASNIGLLSYLGFFDWVRPINAKFHVGTHDVASLMLLAGILAILLTLLRLWFRARQGIKMRAASIGGTFAENAGLKRTAWLMAGLALTNALSGFGGALISMRQGFADISMNQGIIILALAALSLGERLMPRRSLHTVNFVLLSAVAGSVVYQVIVVYTIRVGVNPSDIKLITAAVVLGAICMRRPEQRLLSSEE